MKHIELYPFQSVAILKPIENWWLMATCDFEVARYYCWLAKKWGIEIDVGARHGPHISVVKGEKPFNKDLWFKLKGRKCHFEYSNQPKTNGYHVWLDVKSRELSNVRTSLGLSEKPFHSFHLTIGRLRHNMDHVAHEPRPRNIKKKKRKPNLQSKY